MTEKKPRTSGPSADSSGQSSGAFAGDPFADPSLRGSGVFRSLKEAFWAGPRPLDVAQIEVTSLCPGRCAYCPHTTMAPNWKSRHMAPETYVKLWPLLRETTRVHLQGWGEPLLHPRFLDMAALARKAGCLVSSTTCGLFMNEELAGRLVDSGLDVIAFSLTGASEAANNAARPGVEYARVLESIRLLQAVRKRKMGVHLELHFAYLMLAGKIDEVRLLPELMQGLGMHAAVVSTLDYIPAPEWAHEAFAPHEREKIGKAERALRDAAAHARKLGMEISYSLPAPEARERCLENPGRSIYVDAEGNLSPCIYVNLPTDSADPMRRVFGNCLTGDPLEQWRGRAFTDFANALPMNRPDTPCVGCPKRFAVGNREQCGQARENRS